MIQQGTGDNPLDTVVLDLVTLRQVDADQVTLSVEHNAIQVSRPCLRGQVCCAAQKKKIPDLQVPSVSPDGVSG